MVNEVRIFPEAEIRQALRLDLETVDVIERAFEALASGKVVMPPIMSMELEDMDGEVDAKTAYVQGFEGFAMKVSTGFYGNAALGLPSLNGLMVLLSARTGVVKAVFLDNGYLTDLRTAAAGAVAARHLAPAEVRTAGVIGTGLQARLQMQAAHLVRPFERLLVWGRDERKAAKCAADLRFALGIEVEAVPEPERVVAESQLVVTTTPAREPIIRTEWLHSGLHITAMGSDMSAKQELEASALAQADVYVCDSVSQCENAGELRAALETGVWKGGRPPELGQVILGEVAGRTSDGDITICDLTGTGAQDTAIATHAFARLGSAGIRVES